MERRFDAGIRPEFAQQRPARQDRFAALVRRQRVVLEDRAAGDDTQRFEFGIQARVPFARAAILLAFAGVQGVAPLAGWYGTCQPQTMQGNAQICGSLNG